MKNGTKEAVVETTAVGALDAIDRRIAALVEQRQKIAQDMQRLAQIDVGAQGALATLEALRAELAAQD